MRWLRDSKGTSCGRVECARSKSASVSIGIEQEVLETRHRSASTVRHRYRAYASRSPERVIKPAALHGALRPSRAFG